MYTISAHPCSWQLAYMVLHGAKPGAGKMKVARRVLEAIEEKAHPDLPWPNPWAVGVTPEQRAKTEADTGRTFDKAHRVSVDLSIEQVEFLREKVRAYIENDAITAHGFVLADLIETLEGVKG